MNANSTVRHRKSDLKAWLEKNLTIRLLLLPLAGLILFLIGVSLPHHDAYVADILLVLAVLLTLLFYVMTFAYVILSFSDDPEKKTFWLVAITCMPLIGNLIYLIFRETANRRQKLHNEHF